MNCNGIHWYHFPRGIPWRLGSKHFITINLRPVTHINIFQISKMHLVKITDGLKHFPAIDGSTCTGRKTGQLRLYPVAGRPTPRWNAQPNSVYISPASSILLWSYSWIILLLTEKISGERSMALIISPI